MMNRMSRVLAIAGLSLGLAVTAMADELVVTTGSPGGSYHNVLGANLIQIMREYGHQPQAVTSRGSVENLDRIASGEAHVGFTQADAYASWSQSNPTANVEIMGSLGKECVYIAVNEDGDISRSRHLGRDGMSIAVGQQGSGSAVTWDYLRTLQDSYQSASTYYRGGIRALASVKTGEIDAFMWVTSPTNLDHDFLRAVRANGSGLELIDVNQWSLDNKLPNGEAVYTMEDVDVEAGRFFTDSIRTPCTSVLVVASGNMEDRALEDIARAVMMNSNRIQGK